MSLILLFVSPDNNTEYEQKLKQKELEMDGLKKEINKQKLEIQYRVEELNTFEHRDSLQQQKNRKLEKDLSTERTKRRQDIARLTSSQKAEQIAQRYGKKDMDDTVLGAVLNDLEDYDVLQIVYRVSDSTRLAYRTELTARRITITKQQTLDVSQDALQRTTEEVTELTKKEIKRLKRKLVIVKLAGAGLVVLEIVTIIVLL